MKDPKAPSDLGSIILKAIPETQPQHPVKGTGEVHKDTYLAEFEDRWRSK